MSTVSGPAKTETAPPVFTGELPENVSQRRVTPLLVWMAPPLPPWLALKVLPVTITRPPRMRMAPGPFGEVLPVNVLSVMVALPSVPIAVTPLMSGTII